MFTPISSMTSSPVRPSSLQDDRYSDDERFEDYNDADYADNSYNDDDNDVNGNDNREYEIVIPPSSCGISSPLVPETLVYPGTPIATATTISILIPEREERGLSAWLNHMNRNKRQESLLEKLRSLVF